MSLEIYTKPRGVRSSPTMGAGQLADKAKSLGVNIITFTLGDLFPKPTPADFAEWEAKLQAAHAANKDEAMYKIVAFEQGHGYAPAAGMPAMRATAAYHFTRDTGMEASAADVRIGHGGKGTLYGTFRWMEKLEAPLVLVGAPGWPTNYDLFPHHTRIAEVDTLGRGLMTPEQLSGALAALGHEPDIILINAPSNPTGMNYDAAEREAVLKVVAEKTAKTLVVFDDPYGKLVFVDNYDITKVLQRGPLEKNMFSEGRVAVVRTASKEYGMAGARVGWLITKNKQLLDSLQNSNESEMGGGDALAQQRTMAALHFGDGFIERTIKELTVKRQMVLDALSTLRHAKLDAPQGTIYAWIDFSKLKGMFVPATAIATDAAREAILSDAEKKAGGFSIAAPADMMRYLAYVAAICPVQGTPFYAPGLTLAAQDWHIRFTFCGNKDELARGLMQLQRAETQLQPAQQAA